MRAARARTPPPTSSRQPQVHGAVAQQTRPYTQQEPYVHA
ncbi:hypothetical protein HMPREF9057_02067 [Actinomyces sp. oral taxon 171 str. F0337]|nr:hypothetical protein HMPREF9057_02067 [Actinomyces sp. oral taxon 171 str. F0337]